MSEQARLSAIVIGHVQGVGYRYFAQQEAHRLRLTGYALNKPNGNVEIVAEGDRRLLNVFLAELRRGPISAEVTDIQAEFASATGEFIGFRVKKWS